MRVVIDTNVFISALLNPDAAPRQVIRLCLHGKLHPLMGNALLAEFEDVMARNNLFAQCRLTVGQRDELLSAFLSCCNWVPIYFLWRPNLRDEADNHLVELALAGAAETIVTGNRRDFIGSELRFPNISVRTPGELLNLMGVQ